MLYIFLYIFSLGLQMHWAPVSKKEPGLDKWGVDENTGERRMDGEEDEEKMRQEDDKSSRKILQLCLQFE